MTDAKHCFSWLTVPSKIFLQVSARLKTVWAHYLYLKYTAEANNTLAPSTAPSLPTPGKKFMIIRQELNLPQPGLLMGFDSFAKALASDSGMAGTSPVSAEDAASAKSDARKKWSLVAKVLSITSASAGYAVGASGANLRTVTEEQFDPTRRDAALSRARAYNQQLTGPPLPPKPTASVTTSVVASDGSSTGSSPVYEAQQYVFKFVLSFCPPAQPRERQLSRPRLPAPAQAWVSARSRSGSTPPPPPAGLPAPTRRVSGLAQTGLIAEARNASPADSSAAPGAPRLSISSAFSRSLGSPTELGSIDYFGGLSGSNSLGSNTPTEEREPVVQDHITLPIKPTGMYRSTATYAGRALAEWVVVVAECNAFIERRREEGVLGLSEVEVPLLGVEGFKKIG